jgi:hypothetical protein
MELSRAKGNGLGKYVGDPDSVRGDILNKQPYDSTVSASEVQPPADLIAVSSHLAQGTVNKAKHVRSVLDVKPGVVGVGRPEHEIVDVHPPRDPGNRHRRDDTSQSKTDPPGDAISARMAT